MNSKVKWIGLGILTITVVLFTLEGFSGGRNPGALTQVQSSVPVKREVTIQRGEIVYVSGNDVVIKMEDGLLWHFANIGDSVTVIVDGKQLNVHELKPGMKIEKQTITTTTPRIITKVEALTGKVWHVAPPNSVTLTQEDGTNQSFRIPKGQKFTVNGQETDVWGLKKGMVVSAQKVTEIPETVVTQEVRVTGTMPPPPPPPKQDVPILIVVMAPGRAPVGEAAAAEPALPKLPKTEGEEEPPKNAKLARYANIVSPDEVVVEREFAVEISLTRTNLSPKTRIEQGAVTPEGRLRLPLPSKPTWTIQVVLSAPGFQLTRETNFSDIELPQGGDSTRALFHMKAKATEIGKTSRVMADFYYENAYLATAAKDIIVTTTGTPSQTSTSRSPALRAGPVAPQSPMLGQTRLDLANLGPDMTVHVRVASGDGASKNSFVYIKTDEFQGKECEAPDSSSWLRLQYEKIDMLEEQGRAVVAGARAGGLQEQRSAFMQGFGRELYQRFAPSCFKEVFWSLVDILGPRFKTIEIFTNDPSFPWELMRPIRDNSSEERNFLGLEFAIGRWHLDEVGPLVKMPAQTQKMEKLSVIAPHYSGEQSLGSQEKEVAALAHLSGYSKVSGTIASSARLFRNPPDGIVHFAGHGAVNKKGTPDETYAILLEDGSLDLMAWKGLVSASPRTHPLFFFNACDIGQAQEVLRFVDGWGPAVLRSGASGYIGALWAVKDGTAAEFAMQYYKDFEKVATGTARPAEVLMRTRKTVYERSGDPTALAYIYYGDVNLTLRLVTPKSNRR